MENYSEPNLLDNLITNLKVLSMQKQALSPSKTYAEAVFKQLWAN